MPPEPTTATATADTTLSPSAPNTNDGAGQQLRLAGWPSLGRQLGLVAFDPAELEAFLAAGPVERAWLVLTSADQSGGRRGHWVAAAPLRAAFIEGNGNVAENDRGTGWGATWNCAEDAEIADDIRECVQESYASGERLRQGHAWWRDRGSRDRAVVFQPDGYSGQVIWDVTRNVERGVSAWTIRSLRGDGSLSYYAREGAAALGDPSLAPTLILTHPAEDVVAEVADD